MEYTIVHYGLSTRLLWNITPSKMECKSILFDLPIAPIGATLGRLGEPI